MVVVEDLELRLRSREDDLALPSKGILVDTACQSGGVSVSSEYLGWRRPLLDDRLHAAPPSPLWCPLPLPLPLLFCSLRACSSASRRRSAVSSVSSPTTSPSAGGTEGPAEGYTDGSK